MGIDPGRNEAERQVIEEIIRFADDRVALKMLREETTLLTLMVRVDNEEKRAEYIAKQELKAEDENA